MEPAVIVCLVRAEAGIVPGHRKEVVLCAGFPEPPCVMNLPVNVSGQTGTSKHENGVYLMGNDGA